MPRENVRIKGVLYGVPSHSEHAIYPRNQLFKATASGPRQTTTATTSIAASRGSAPPS